jgi:hypothetical protein
MIRHRLDDGLSWHAIAAELNRAKIRTRTGKRWHATTVRKVLESRTALGYFRAGDEWIKGKHRPIVSEEVFAALRETGGEFAKFHPGARPGRRPRRHLFINGHLVCDRCGGAMYARSHPSDPAFDKYGCSTVCAGESCPTGWLKRADVDTRFLALFERDWISFEGTRERIAEELDRTLAEVGDQAASADVEVARVEARIAKLEEDYFADELKAARFEELTAKAEEDLAAAVAARDRLAERAGEVRQSRESVDAESETLRRLSQLRDTVRSYARDDLAQADLEALRGIVGLAFPKVRVTSDGRIVGLEPGTSMYVSTMARQIHEGPRYALPLAPRGSGAKKVNGRSLRV